MQRSMSNNMHTLDLDATFNMQHTFFHTSAVKQVHMSMNNYQGQTIMVSPANLCETPCAKNLNMIQQGVSHIFSPAAQS